MDERTQYPAVRSSAQPPCPECTVALDPAGRGRHLYWVCRYCGVTMPRF